MPDKCVGCGAMAPCLHCKAGTKISGALTGRFPQYFISMYRNTKQIRYGKSEE